MYADDLTLLADSPAVLQSMLDITHKYANKWRYTFNTDKSVVMVLGETSRSRAALRMARRWKLGEQSDC